MKDSFNLKFNCSSFTATALLAIIFAVSYAQSPLYTSNQNTYFLHGLAKGGLGFLSHDWMANTTDPFPLFSLLVSSTYSNLPTYFFYIYYVVILGVFIYSILGIASKVSGIDGSYREYLTYFVVVTTLCSGAFALLSSKVFYVNLSAIFQNGVAEQFILGIVFQPSVFGVLLLLSIYTFLCNKPFLAILCLGVAANFHATYLLSAAALTVSYMMIIILEDKNWKRSILLGTLSLILVIPVVSYSYLSFATTSSEVLNQAQNILIDYRIPHHAKIADWFGIVSLIQIVIVILAVVLMRKKRIWLIILMPFLVSLSLTLVQLLNKSNYLALQFPWRISAFLVPLSAFVLVGGFVSFIFRRYNQLITNYKKVINIALTTGLIILLLSGIYAFHYKFEKHNGKGFTAMMNFVTDSKEKGDIYLIPIELERFRLQTGAPIFVDRKTNPYKDIEIVEWYDRIQIADKFFKGSMDSRCDVLRDISSRYGVTHVVIDSEQQLPDCSFLRNTYKDGKYYIYKIEAYE